MFFAIFCFCVSFVLAFVFYAFSYALSYVFNYYIICQHKIVYLHRLSFGLGFVKSQALLVKSRDLALFYIFYL